MSKTPLSDFDAEQKRYLEGMAAGISAVRHAGATLASGPAALPPEPTGPDAVHLKAQDKVTAGGGKLSEQEKWKRAENPFDGYGRLAAVASEGEAPKPDDNFRWRYHGLFYVAPTQKVLHGAAAHPERHPQPLAVRRLRRSRRSLRRRLQPRHHPRQPADPRDHAGERAALPRGPAGSRADGARRRRRQHPQRHRLAERRHRPAGASGHAAAGPGLALPHPERSLAVRPAAQIQRRLRRRRPHPGPRGDERHRLPGGRAARRRRPRSRRLDAPRARRHHRPQGLGARHRRRLPAEGMRRAGRRDRARLHRERRPHRTATKRPPEIRARQLGVREIPGGGRGEAGPASSPASRRTSSRRARRRTASRISACIARSRTA